MPGEDYEWAEKAASRIYRTIFKSNVNFRQLANHKCILEQSPPTVTMRLKHGMEKQQIEAQLLKLDLTRSMFVVTQIDEDTFSITLLEGHTFKGYRRLRVKRGDRDNVAEVCDLLVPYPSCIQFQFVLSVYDQTKHCCIPQMQTGLFQCRGKHLHEGPETRIPITICKTSSKVHLCGRWCKSEYQTLATDSRYVCSISGQVIGGPYVAPQYPSMPSQPDVVNPFAAMHTFTHRNSRENLFSDGTATLTTSPAPQIEKSNLKCYSDFLAYAYNAFLVLLNDDNIKRHSTDVEKHYENTASLIHKEGQRMMASTGSLDMLKLLDILESYKSKNLVMGAIDFTVDERKDMAATYAMKAVKMWYILMTQTSHGQKKKRSGFSFYRFLSPFLILIANGVMLADGTQIVPPDPFMKHLILMLNVDAVLYPEGQSTSLEKRVRDSSNICSAAKKALLDAAEYVSIEKLRYDTLTTAEMDKSVFVPEKTRRGDHGGQGKKRKRF